VITAGSSAFYIFDIPRPPSVNEFEHGLGNSSPIVQRWIKAADRFVMALAPKPLPRLTGPFEVYLTWPSSTFTTSDIDNRVKPLLDWLERIEMISDDRFCFRIVVEFGAAPEGCRVKLLAHPDVELPHAAQSPPSHRREDRAPGSRRYRRRYARRQPAPPIRYPRENNR
jgi:hypothetical protein